jgi:hypothetical protein
MGDLVPPNLTVDRGAVIVAVLAALPWIPIVMNLVDEQLKRMICPALNLQLQSGTS